MKGHIYINVAGEGYFTLRLPESHEEEEKILLFVKEWVKAHPGFDSYENSLTLGIWGNNGARHYLLQTPHAGNLVQRVMVALDKIRSQATVSSVA